MNRIWIGRIETQKWRMTSSILLQYHEVLTGNISNAEGDTTALDSEYLETVTIHDREYQKHSVDNNIHLVPVDEVASPRRRIPGKG